MYIKHTSDQYNSPDSEVSIIVPTRNEADNIAPLISRLEKSMRDHRFEVIFVDDSTDRTPEVIRTIGQNASFAINLIERPPERRNGLGKAVVEGLCAAKSSWAVVMDGDLQHPPEVIPQMLERAKTDNADIVVASRLAEGGSTDGLSLYRKFISYALAFGSRVAFPKNLRAVTDPMTGFFAVNRANLKLDELKPPGFKILLEILCRNPRLKIAEIPFEFGKRNSGQSNADGREMMRLFQQVLELRFGHTFLNFLVVGASGLVVNTALLYMFADWFNLHYLVAAVLATQGSTLWNFVLSEIWVFKGRPQAQDTGQRWRRMATYYLMNNGLLVARGPVLALMVSVLGINYLVSNLFTLIVITMIRFTLSDKLIWQRERNMENKRGKLFHYSIHDIIYVRSEKRLPELDYFKTSEAFDAPDIDVKVVANPSAYRNDTSLAYDESLGRFGFSIVINRTEEITNVYASTLIGMSPHVLYTNVVEPLLRWMFVRKGYALMHGACLAFDGSALFITAQTDTGKTTTILHTVRSNLDTAHFLSDDMTILSRDGSVMSYPKPLTISKHTLHAVGVSPLQRLERMFLQIQSRLHSKSGRRVGMVLADGAFPAATLNAIVQAIIPPPKYMVDYLVPGTTYDRQAQLSQIVVIERGDKDVESEISDLEKTNILVANAEDAYGFPPYPVLADALSHWNGKDLHAVEAEIVKEAIDGLPGTYLKSANFGWYKRLPHLVSQISKQKAEQKAEAPAPAPVTADIPVELGLAQNISQQTVTTSDVRSNNNHNSH